MGRYAGAGIALLIALPLAENAAPAPAAPTPAASATQASTLVTDALLARYRLAIQVLKQPPNMVVDYTQTRSGPTRVITENHRLYRDAAGNERNEITAINGVPALRRKVSIYSRATWTYSADKFFVDPETYQVGLRGAVQVEGRKGYTFAAVMKEAGPFSVTDVDIDARTALPLREHFVASSPTCSATGSIVFGFARGYWLPKIVSVTCPVVASPDAPVVTPPVAAYRDTIRFSSYSFPAAIPAQVFGLSPSPAPTATAPPP